MEKRRIFVTNLSRRGVGIRGAWEVLGPDDQLSSELNVSRQFPIPKSGNWVPACPSSLRVGLGGSKGLPD